MVLNSKTFCSCCDACAKQVGEECQDSYHYNLKGKCDEGLFCYYSSGALDHNEWAAGVCRGKLLNFFVFWKLIALKVLQNFM